MAAALHLTRGLVGVTNDMLSERSALGTLEQITQNGYFRRKADITSALC